jgi:hypothetical protein
MVNDVGVSEVNEMSDELTFEDKIKNLDALLHPSDFTYGEESMIKEEIVSDLLEIWDEMLQRLNIN